MIVGSGEIKALLALVVFPSVVKAVPVGEPEKALGHDSTRSNRSNRWLNRITVETECEAVVRFGPVLTTLT